MDNKKIAICGADSYWKHSLLKMFCQLHQANQPVMNSFFDYGTITASLTVDNTNIAIITLQNAFLSEKKAYAALLQEVDAIIYIISEATPKGEDSFVAGSKHDQNNILHNVELYSKQFDVFWNQRPWIWVVTPDIPGHLKNKSYDLEFINPFEKIVPPDQDIIRCSLGDTSSIEYLYRQAIKSVIK